MATFSRWHRYWLNSPLHRLRIRQQVPAFLRSCPEPFRGEVLEVGAGSGYTSRRILETFPQVELTAVDIDEKATGAFTALRKKYGRRLNIKQANILNLFFDRNSFDIVLAINVMPYLQPYGVKVALRELLRVTRPGGLIGISDQVLLARLFSSQRHLIEDTLSREKCDILYVKGGKRYDMWIRKAYPVEGGGSS